VEAGASRRDAAEHFEVSASSAIRWLATRSIEILKVAKTSEQLRNDGFEVIARGPEGMKKRIDDEVPKWHDIIAKAGIKPV
jgi:hypothetical protein